MNRENPTKIDTPQVQVYWRKLPELVKKDGIPQAQDLESYKRRLFNFEKFVRVLNQTYDLSKENSFSCVLRLKHVQSSLVKKQKQQKYNIDNYSILIILSILKSIDFKVNIAIVVMMAIMMVQASLVRVLQRPLDQINNPAVFSKRNPGPIAFNPSAVNKKEENFEIPTVQAEEITDDGSLLARTKRHHKGGYYGGYNRGGYYGYRYPYYSYNNG